MNERLTEALKYAKSLWDIKFDYSKKLPKAWYLICRKNDIQVIKSAIVTLYKEVDYFDIYDKDQVKYLANICKSISGFKINEI